MVEIREDPTYGQRGDQLLDHIVLRITAARGVPHMKSIKVYEVAK